MSVSVCFFHHGVFVVSVFLAAEQSCVLKGLSKRDISTALELVSSMMGRAEQIGFTDPQMHQVPPLSPHSTV